jgi:hypothetical protein
LSIESDLAQAAAGVGAAASQPRVLEGGSGEIAAMLRTVNAQRKELDQCRQKLAIATESTDYWQTRALRAEKDVE